MANTKKYVSLDKLGLYDEKIKGVISAGDTATLDSAKKYVDDSLKLYETAGTAATEAGKVQANLDAEILRAKAVEEANAAAAKKAQDEVDALELVVDTKANASDLTALAGKVGEVPADTTVMDIITNIQENAYDDTAIQNAITTLQNNKADKTQVATDIADAVKVETDARVEAINGVNGTINTLTQTHATDKKNLEDAIALKADQTALDEVAGVANAAVKQADYDVKVAALEAEDARIAGLVTAEAERAAGVEAGLEERLVEVETFFKTTDEETLDTALDTLVELQKYLSEEGAVADQMLLDIAANKKAIEDHVAVDHDFAGADAALKSELEGKINAKADTTVVEGIDGRLTTAEGKITTVEGKVSTLEGQMTTVQGAVATKAEAQALTDAVTALQGVDAGQETRLQALEAKFGEGEGNVEDMIADAKQEAIDTAAEDATTKANKALEDAKKYADEEDAKIEERVTALETASATHALAADLTALTTRVTTAEGEIDTLQGEMDAVEALAAANKAAHEANAAAIALKASQDDLTSVSNRVTTLETWHNNFTEVSVEEINNLFA